MAKTGLPHPVSVEMWKKCGIHVDMSDEPDILVLHLLRGIRADMVTKGELADARSDFADLRSDVRSLRADIASDLLTMEAKNMSEHKMTREQITGLRRAVMEYHSSVIGHGILISELEDRIRRVEQHLNLPSMEPH